MSSSEKGGKGEEEDTVTSALTQTLIRLISAPLKVAITHTVL